jgi:hypothetical protein
MQQNKKFQKPVKDGHSGEKKGGFRNFFDSGKKIQTQVRP